MIRRYAPTGHRVSIGLVGLAALGLLLVAPIAAAEDYFGFDLEKLATATAHQSNFNSTYAPAESEAAFDAYLRDEMGSDRAAYSRAYNQWWGRFQADESGRLQARFHTIMNRVSQELTFGDVPDQSQDTREGVSLDTYAKIVVAMTRTPNPDVGAIATAHGLDGKEHFDRVNAAWAQAMANDSTHTLTQQYGSLYQKHAGAGFAAEQEAKLADLLAKRNRPRETPPQRQEPKTAADYAETLTSPVAKDRWYAARQLAFQCNRYRIFGEKAGEGLEPYCTEAPMRRDLVPVIRELLQEFDDRNVNLASGILDLVLDLELGDAVGRETAEGALRRAEKRLAELEAEFAPIQHKAVPQKSRLRTAIDTHRVSIREFERHLGKW